MRSSSSVPRRTGLIVAAALAVLCLQHLYSLYLTRHRPLHFDEAQYLHVSWLMAQGRELYRDFSEDHSPFLFLIFRALIPADDGSSLDLLTYGVRARVFASACGLLAIAAVAALTYRATRSLLAPLIATATLLVSTKLWYRGLADARNDPPSLLLFWLGALLLAAPWKSDRARFVLAGTGIGLAVAAAAWNPKMPLECVVLGAVYLWRLKEAFHKGLRTAVWTVAPAVFIVGITLLVIVATVSWKDYVFFTFQYNVVLGEWNARAFDPLPPFLYCDRAFKGAGPTVVTIAAIGIVSLRQLRARVRELDVRAYGIVLALAAAALADIRFLFPYPNLWAQYYVMWGFAVAALYGMTAAALVRALNRPTLEAAAQIAAVLVAIPITHAALPKDPGPQWPWAARVYLMDRLRPGETVWVTPEVHPIAAHDASYYWFAFADLVPASLAFTAAHPEQKSLPPMRQEDLPVCRAERGLEPHLRYVSAPEVFARLPLARQCLERMIAGGRATRTHVRDVWDLKPSRTQ